MSVGLCFLKKMIEQGAAISYMTDNGIGPDHFVDVERRAYDFVQTHAQAYSALPSVGVIERELEIRFPSVPESTLDFWTDRLKQIHKARQIRDAVKATQLALSKGEVEEASELLQVAATTLHETGPVRVRTLASLAEDVLARHDALRFGQNLIEVPFGFPYLDAISDGLQKGDTVALAGETGIGKTYVVCAMAQAAHRAGKVPLIVSMEMRDFLVARRILALRLQLNETRLRRGRLATMQGRQALVDDMRALKEEPPFYIMDGKLIYSIEDLILHIKTLHPDVVYVDGAYLLESKGRFGGKWENIAEAAKQLKILAGVTDIPIVGTYQLQEKKKIYGGRAIEHLASIVLHLMADSDEESLRSWDGLNYRLLRINKGRYGEFGTIRLVYNMVNQAIVQREVVSGRSFVEEEIDEQT